jgi:hypothetical protein
LPQNTQRAEEKASGLVLWLSSESQSCGGGQVVRRHATTKASNKLLAVAELNSDTWGGEVKRLRGKRLPLIVTGATTKPD